MPDVLTIREAVERAKAEGLPVSEYALRQWVRTGAVPSRRVGQKALLFYPNLVRYLQCQDGADNLISVVTAPGVRQVAIGEDIGKSGERVRCIEREAMRLMRKPKCSRHIKDFAQFDVYNGAGLGAFRASGMSIQEKYLIWQEKEAARRAGHKAKTTR